MDFVQEVADVQPVAFLQVGFMCGAELEDWELEAKRGLCDELNEKHINKPTTLPLYTHPPAADVRELVRALRNLLRGIFDGPDDSDAAMIVNDARAALAKWEGK